MKIGNETRKIVGDDSGSSRSIWSPQTHPWLVEAAKKGGTPLETFTAPEYSKEVAGYNVTQYVHVDAAWPTGDPQSEKQGKQHMHVF